MNRKVVTKVVEGMHKPFRRVGFIPLYHKGKGPLSSATSGSGSIPSIRLFAMRERSCHLQLLCEFLR